MLGANHPFFIIKALIWPFRMQENRAQLTSGLRDIALLQRYHPFQCRILILLECHKARHERRLFCVLPAVDVCGQNFDGGQSAFTRASLSNLTIRLNGASCLSIRAHDGA